MLNKSTTHRSSGIRAVSLGTPLVGWNDIERQQYVKLWRRRNEATRRRGTNNNVRLPVSKTNCLVGPRTAILAIHRVAPRTRPSIHLSDVSDTRPV